MKVVDVISFIKKARFIHNDIYDYSLVNYRGNKFKVDIICRKHGLFSQEANSHLRGSGCPVCGELARRIHYEVPLDEKKICKKCKKPFPRNETFFYKQKSSRDKLSVYCRECQKQNRREWIKNNPDKPKEYLDKLKETGKLKEINHKNYLKNKKSGKIKQLKERRYANAVNRVVDNLRNSIWRALKREDQQCEKFFKLWETIGCSKNELKECLESQFVEGMSWDNYGQGDNYWNVHHTPPLASYDFTDPVQQKEASHWTHLSPKWALENLSIGSLYNGIRYTKKAS